MATPDRPTDPNVSFASLGCRLSGPPRPCRRGTPCRV